MRIFHGHPIKAAIRTNMKHRRSFLMHWTREDHRNNSTYGRRGARVGGKVLGALWTISNLVIMYWWGLWWFVYCLFYFIIIFLKFCCLYQWRCTLISHLSFIFLDIIPPPCPSHPSPFTNYNNLLLPLQTLPSIYHLPTSHVLPTPWNQSSFFPQSINIQPTDLPSLHYLVPFPYIPSCFSSHCSCPPVQSYIPSRQHVSARRL